MSIPTISESPSPRVTSRVARHLGAGTGFDGTFPVGYEILYALGEGSFSEVWKVRQQMTGRFGALKRLRPEWRAQAAARQLLRNESEVGRAVKSAHVVRVYFSEVESEDPFVILEWLNGTSLEEILAAQERLPIRKALWIARQCAAGLADLEQQGFAHGDVKPGNIFVCAQGDVKLVDLGFARPLLSAGEGTLTGTPEYMAPESLSPAECHPTARDVYSLGVTLYRMLTGLLPFTGDSASATLRMQRGARPLPLKRFCPEASVELCEFLSRMLAKHPLRRPTDMQSLLRELIRLELSTLTD
ncbi:MAG: serine/threonine-protein kinase [Planctomycetaceae bacterium]